MDPSDGGEEASVVKTCPGETTPDMLEADKVEPTPPNWPWEDQPDGKPGDPLEQRRRATRIKEAVRFSFDGYRKRAWGKDGVKPISGSVVEGSFGLAVTMVDSLDTLWLAGLKQDFALAKEWLLVNLPSRIAGLGPGVSIFETVIRVLGGLEGAGALANDQQLLDLARLLGNALIEKVRPNGVTPYTIGGSFGGMGCPSLAESGTSQLEYRYLSNVTKDPRYEEKVMKFYEHVRSMSSLDGLYANCYQQGHGSISLGADGDSFYEYLLKAWLQGGRKEAALWEMFNSAMDGMEKHMLSKTTDRGDPLTFIDQLNRWDGKQGYEVEHSMEHLTCFVPGVLALGAPYQEYPKRRERHMRLAADLAYTCFQMYDQQPTKIAPERVKSLKLDLSKTDTKEYILRPEAMEAWWYLYERTGEQKYREWGWEAFVAFERYLKQTYGYASLQNVLVVPSREKKFLAPRSYIDRMESFWIAETLKYAFLLQDPRRQITLDKWVMNTEAHPLPLPRVPGMIGAEVPAAAQA